MIIKKGGANMSPQTKAHIKASNKYNQKAYDRININVKKGKREQIKAYAESKGKSLNQYIIDLIEEDMKEGESIDTGK